MFRHPLALGLRREVGTQKAPANPFITSCPGASKTVAEAKPDAPFQATTSVIPDLEYKPSGSKSFFIGDSYRSSWLQPVTMKTPEFDHRKRRPAPRRQGERPPDDFAQACRGRQLGAHFSLHG